MRKLKMSCFAMVAALLSVVVVPSPVRAAEAPSIRVVVWDEQQPEQKRVYDNFLGNAIVDYLKSQPGFAVRSVRFADPEQGLSADVLDHCDVMIWWSHFRSNPKVPLETGKRIVERIKAGRMSLITLHSAHWSSPFVAAMWERTTEDALKSLPQDKRSQVKIRYVYPKLYQVPRPGEPPTPSWAMQRDAEGKEELVIRLPVCVFPAFRADGKPSHIKTLLPEHPIAAGIPKEFDLLETEMYDEPFWVPEPDAVVFEERWDRGEHFRSGCVWNIGKGKVFYFRPGHEIYPVYKQPIPLKILANAARWLGSELPGRTAE